MIPFEVEFIGKTVQVELNEYKKAAMVNGEEIHFSIVEHAHHRFLIRVGTKLHKCDNIIVSQERLSFSINGDHVEVKIKDEEQLLLEKLGFTTAQSDLQGIITAPMPGKILDITVSEGDEVEKGEAILILEAMKMENELKSTITGIVHTIHVKTGESVEKNQILLEIKARG